VERRNSNNFLRSDSQTTSNSPEGTHRSCDIESVLKTRCQFFGRHLNLQKTEKSEKKSIMRTQLNCSAVKLFKLYFRWILQAAFIVQFDECVDGETFLESALLQLIENWELQFELILLYTTRPLQCRSFPLTG